MTPNIKTNLQKCCQISQAVLPLDIKYVTKNIFDAITNHPKVVYLYPDSLKEEVSVNFLQNTITALSPIKQPQEKNFQNDFQWEYDSSHLEYVDCLDVETKFENVANGIMLNCYPENIVYRSPSLLQLIKEY